MATSKARVSKKKVATKKVATKKVATKKAASPLGREGTLSFFFRNAIVNTKKKPATVLREARKKFPEKDVPDSYYAWYTAECKRKKLISRKSA